MSADLVPIPRRGLGRTGFGKLPAIVVRAGDRAAWRFVEFFTATIRNRNTRAAYAHAVKRFFAWCEAHRVQTLEEINPVVIAAYIEHHPAAAPTVKQHLAAIRMLFDFLVTGQVVPMNPASSVRGPKHVVKVGKTPVLKADQARALIDSIKLDTIVGLRDRAIIAAMCFTFARVSAMVHMKVDDYYENGKRWWIRLHEKGGEASRSAGTPQCRSVPRRVSRCRWHPGRKEIPALSERGPTREDHGKPHGAHGRLAHGEAACARGRAPLFDLLPHLPGYRHHGLP
jgi:integrase